MTTEQGMEAGGVDLKAAREAAGLTLKDMFARTRISVAVLEAIENGDFHLLPVPIYTRNFIKTYAESLNIDGALILKHYEDHLHARRMMENEATLKTAEEKKSFLKRVAPYRSYLWVLLIVIVFGTIALFVSINDRPEPDMLQSNAQATLAAARDIQTQEEASSATDEAPPGLPDGQPLPQDEAVAALEMQTTQAVRPTAQPAYTGAGENPSTLIVTALEETWIRITADQQPPFEALLQPGEKISRKASKFDMDIGNAGGVRIMFQGKTIDNLGQSGQVIHLRLPSAQ
ncbi:MAG: DUF4115 domain-containing protein [Smithellaceae bacterium]